MEDIDSDDEDPEIEMHFKEAGLKFQLFSNISELTYLKCFFIPHKLGLMEKLPNFSRYISLKTGNIMESQGSLHALAGTSPL
mmetsp:Transcript_36247/g.55678  ORF Transcript_36247/g.55678 Transcript_36247/m.55678 type:complete len:82 (+) Transcript_36247:672-917(+)